MYDHEKYKYLNRQRNVKKIILNNKRVQLGLGTHFCKDNSLVISSLMIYVFYEKQEEKLTTAIPYLQKSKDLIAISPDFSNIAIINKLRDLNIIKKVEEVTYNNTKYKIAKVNFEELKLYKPLGYKVIDEYIYIHSLDN